MTTVQTSTPAGNRLGNNVSAPTAPFAIDFLDRTRPAPARSTGGLDCATVVLQPIHATIGLPAGRVGNFAKVDLAEELPGQFVRVRFRCNGAPRDIIGIFQFVTAGVVRVVSMPDTVFRRVHIDDIVGIELLTSLESVRGEA